MRIDWQPDEDSAYLTTGSDNLALHRGGEKDNETQDGVSGLDHFGFVVSHADEVEAWALRLAAQGVKLEQLPKEHRDGSRSFYFRDPDGNLIQILFHPHIFES